MMPRILAPAVFALVLQGAVLPVPERPASGEYSHRLWRIEDGLPQNRIRALCQTPDGYLWVGTSEGLARFDGVRFTVFDQSNTPALRDDGILSLRAGAGGALWIGTEGGGLVRYERGIFRAFGADDGVTNGFVRALHEDRGKTLWVGTDRGFFRQTGERFTRLDGTDEVPLASVFSIGEDDAARIWISSASGLLSVENGVLKRHAGCAPIPIRSLHASSQGFVWAIGNAGATRMKDGCVVRDAALPNVPMRSLVEDQERTLWIGTMSQGLLRIDQAGTTTFTSASGLPDNTVNAIFEDRERNLWIGCEDGLVRLTRRSGTNIGSHAGLEDDNVLTLYPDRQKALWLSTFSGQIYRVVRGVANRYRLPGAAADLRARTVYQDRRGAFWFGTLGGGVVRQEGGNAKVFTKSDGLRSNTIRQILEDRSGMLWLALDSGLARWDGTAFHNYYLPDGLSYPSTRCMLVDRNGDLLVGTDAGLNRIHDLRVVKDHEFDAVANERIWSMYEDDAGALWLGTRGGGLLRLASGKVTRFTRENGLRTNTIFQILDDGDRTLWMSTSLGVVSVDRRELDTAAQTTVPTIHTISYGTADGMATSQMNGGFQPAGARTANGELWFASVKGAVRIQPSRRARSPLPVLIERILTDDQALPPAENVILPPRRGRVAIDFTLCDLVDPQRVSFRYRLESFEDKWNQAVRGRSASYTNLPPGRYRFHVVGSDASSSDVAEAFVDLTVQPAFYQTGWFYFSLAIAGGLAIWACFALYARQTRARYALLLRERTRLAREMHDTVIQGCVGVATLLDAAAQFRAVDAAESEALLDQARVQAKSTLEEARQAVWDLRHPETAESSIAMLFDLAKKLGAEQGIEMETQTAGTGNLDAETDRTLLLVGREALRNAVTHAAPRHISMRIVFEAESVTLEILDDGCGFKAQANGAEQGPHFGITGMRERVERLGGSFSIRSTPGSGTRVTVSIPSGGRRVTPVTTQQSRAGAP